MARGNVKLESFVYGVKQNQGVTSNYGAGFKANTTVPATSGAVAAGAPLTLFKGGPSFYVTSNTPTFAAVKGSVCINTGGSGTGDRMYINTDGSTTWASVTTSA